jgi:hypothetical protein
MKPGSNVPNHMNDEAKMIKQFVEETEDDEAKMIKEFVEETEDDEAICGRNQEMKQK